MESDMKTDDANKDQLKPSLIREHCVLPQPMVTSSSTTAVINPLKNTSCDTPLSNINIAHNSNEHQKNFSRRNTVQPLLKKPISNAPTTSIKPLILPAPTSDSFSQHTKSNLVSIHNSHQSNSISTPFNCQQPMTMGIATIQPQHFGYQNISNNRYPMIPMSIQNNYQPQQLTLTNGGLGTTVQLMPVMNQNNNQMNNSRVQSVPVFMAPIIGSHGGMLFQPNMTLMPQNSNPMQTFNISNTTYSHDFNHCQSVLSQTINPTTLRQSIVMPNEIDSYPKSEMSTTMANSTTTIATIAENNIANSKISTSIISNDPSLSTRPNVKQRGLIRTQIYRMKEFIDEENMKERHYDSPAPVESSSTHEDHEEISALNLDIEKKDIQDLQDTESTNDCPTKIPVEPEITSVDTPSPPPPAIEDVTPITCSVTSETSDKKDVAQCISSTAPVDRITEPKPSQTLLTHKRKLPSPEILDCSQPIKVARLSHSDEQQSLSGRKSPGSLFEKISQVIPERKTEILQNYKANKLTAVVRPEQRKMLVHYLDDLVIFESDEPFPTTNKMQVVKSALRAGNIKLTPQKSKLLNDQYLFLSADEDISPTKHILRPSNKLSPIPKSTSFLEPLTIDIPTTTTSSSCDSLDSSQVRPLSMCSYQSTLPATVLSKKTSVDNISPEKDMPKIEKELSTCSAKSALSKETETDGPQQVAVEQVPGNSRQTETTEVTATAATTTAVVAATAVGKDQVKPISPVKQANVVRKSGLDRPICDWTVADVVDFVRQTPGCENYTAMFQNHEIDGEALLLLSKDNLIQGALNMKIGPALKLCARIDKRRALDPQ